MTTIDTTEGIEAPVTGYIEPAEQTGSDDETEPVHPAFAVGDLVQVTNGLNAGQFATVVWPSELYGPNIRLIFGDEHRSLAYAPHELKLIRRAERPGWKPIEARIYRPRVYKASDGKWVCEDDIRLLPRFRHPDDGRPVPYRDHDSYEAALTTVREQAAIDQAKRDAVEITSKGIVA